MYSAPAAQHTFRPAPGRAAIPQPITRSWAPPQSAGAPFRPGHQYSSSAGALLISAPLRRDGSPSRPLGSGVQVVRTPQEALETLRGPSPGHSPPTRPPPVALDSSDDDGGPPTPPAKPFVAPLAVRPRSPPKTAPRAVPVNPSSPVHVSPTALVSPPPPPFRPIIMSKVPSQVIDRSQVLVTIETASMSLKTTFETLTSRPSHLSTFLKNIIQTPQDGDVVSEGHSAASDATSPFRSLFQDHLVASGVLPETTHSIHLFLDRPSESYPHILAYLRAPGSHLPHSVKLSQKLEDLVALRDEARFLDLIDLARLCTDELSRHRMVRVGTGVAHVAPLERIHEQQRSWSPPDPIITHTISPPSPPRIVSASDLPSAHSIVPKPGYI